MTVRRFLASSLLILLLLPAAAFGQSFNGAITGVVRDCVGRSRRRRGLDAS